MSFIAEAERIIDGRPERVFEHLADFESWPRWMPPSFLPVKTPEFPCRPLGLGDRFRVRVGGAPFATTLRVSVLERPRELAWRGGIALLWAEHRFIFEPEGGERTRVRSIETWKGALAGAARALIQPMAIRIGAEQLEGLARAARGAGPPRPRRPRPER